MNVGIADVRAVLEKAAEIVSGLYHPDVAVSRKGDGSPLTEADLRVNALLHRELSDLAPFAGWLSEETVDDSARLDREWVWVVDPLDGTKEFARGYPEFAVSIGLVHDGQPFLGAIVNPATGEGGAGIVGEGAQFWGMNGRREAAVKLSDAIASVSRSETEDGSVLPFLRLVGHTRPVGSVAYKLLRVAAGIDDLTFSVQGKSEWDICGGVCLLCAADKEYRRLDGVPLRFNQRTTRIPSGAAAGPRGLVLEFFDRYAALGPERAIAT